MIPEQKCVSLETAKLLAQAGFLEETQYTWFQDEESQWQLLPTERNEGKSWEGCASAPDAQEIGGLLPDGYFTYRRGTSWFTGKDLHQLAVGVATATEAEARATLWLWLKEQKLI